MNFLYPLTAAVRRRRAAALLAAAVALTGCAFQSAEMPPLADDAITPASAAAKAAALPLPPHLAQADDAATDEAFAQWLAAQRQRVQAGREQAQAAYEQAERQCWQRFAVNDCLHRALVAKRQTLADLRTQELALNAHERQRHTAQRLRALSGGQTP